MAELIVKNARITTLDPKRPAASAIAVANGVVVAVGDDRSVLEKAGSQTRIIDAGGRRLIPGLNDSHTHLIRGGLSYDLELRWDGVKTLADAMAMLKAQGARRKAQGARTSLASVLGILAALLIGAGCRFFGIPSPAPMKLQGALLVLAMTLGFVLGDRLLG